MYLSRTFEVRRCPFLNHRQSPKSNGNKMGNQNAKAFHEVSQTFPPRPSNCSHDEKQI